jgi:hypothetical protein
MGCGCHLFEKNSSENGHGDSQETAKTAQVKTTEKDDAVGFGLTYKTFDRSSDSESVFD